MKINVITSVRDSDKQFFYKCLRTQKEWCQAQGYEYNLIENLSIRDMDAKWRNFSILVTLLATSNDGDVLVLLDPSVMVIDPEVPLPLLDAVSSQDEGVWAAQSETVIFHDAIIVKVGKRTRSFLTFASSFHKTPFSAPDFSINLFGLLCQDIYFPVPRRVLSSSWYTNTIQMVEIKSKTEKDVEPGVISNFHDFDLLNDKKFMFVPGDFAVNLSTNKHLCSVLSEEFFALRTKYLAAKQESRQILKEVTS